MTTATPRASSTAPSSKWFSPSSYNRRRQSADSRQQTATTASRYLAVIDGKTARLFATACALGNPLYEDFGLHYGRLFQMRDDIADGEAPDFVNELIERETQEINNLKYILSI